MVIIWCKFFRLSDKVLDFDKAGTGLVQGLFFLSFAKAACKFRISSPLILSPVSTSCCLQKKFSKLTGLLL